MWQIKNISKNKTKVILDFRKKQSDELSAKDLGRLLKITPGVLVRYARSGAFKHIQSYRVINLKSHSVFFINKRDLEKVRKVLKTFFKQPGEMSFQDLAKKMKLDAGFIRRTLSKNFQNKNVHSRNLRIKGRLTKVFKKSDFEKIKSIISKTFKQRNELDQKDLALIFGLNIRTIANLNHKGVFSKIPSYRIIRKKGKEVFLLDSKDLSLIKKAVGKYFKLDDELSSHQIEKILNIDHQSIYRMAKEGHLDKVPSFRMLFSRGQKILLINKKDLGLVKNIIKALRMQPYEISMNKISEKLGFSHEFLNRIYRLGDFNQIDSLRMIEISGHPTFVIHKKHLVQAKKIIKKYLKQPGELSTGDLSIKLKVTSNHLVRLDREGRFRNIPSYRNLIYGGRKTFLIHKRDLDLVRKISRENRLLEDEITKTVLSKEIGFSYITFQKLFRKKIFEGIAGIREMVVSGRPSIVIKRTAIQDVLDRIPNLSWRRTKVFTDFLKWLNDPAVTLSPIPIQTDTKGLLFLHNKRFRGLSFLANARLILLPVKNSNDGEYYFYVLSGWPERVSRMFFPGWETPPVIKTKLDLNKAKGLLIYNRTKKTLVFKKF